MILPNLIFDAVLYGLMAVAVILDSLQPVTHGAATLVVLGFIVFLAAEDAAHFARKLHWGQESFASGIAVSLFGFIYYWWRNDSDTAATALHICLMLSALMVLIGFVSVLGTIARGKTLRPLAGFFATLAAAIALGAAGGLALLFWTSAASLVLKVLAVVVAYGIWRGVLQTRPALLAAAPAAAPVAAASAASSSAAASKTAASKTAGAEAAVEDLGAPRVLRPQGGQPCTARCLLLL